MTPVQITEDRLRERDDIIQDALNRLYRAARKGTGCRLSAEEIHYLNTTTFGDAWNQPDPRKETTNAA